MKIYTEVQIASLRDHRFAFLLWEFEEHVLRLSLNREEKRNALHPQMLNELAYVFQFAYTNPDVWMILIEAKGKVFCAGADLKAFAGMIEPHDSTVPEPKVEILLGNLFQQVHKPVIAKISGDVYAGGFFFLTGSHIVIAQEGLKFGLPEVKRGLYPFQVMAALMDVMPRRKVLDWCIRGYNLPVEEALFFGLVTEMVAEEALDKRIEEVLTELKENSPTAIRLGLEALEHIRPAEKEHKYLLSMLRKTIMSNDAQEGLKAFRQKRLPVWTGQ